MNKKFTAVRQEVIPQQKNDYFSKYSVQAEEVLKKAVDFLFKHPEKNYAVVKLPNSSEDFRLVLEILSRNPEWDLYVQNIWYTKRKVKIYPEEPIWLEPDY